MATMVRNTRRGRRPERIEEREQDQIRSVREICLVGTAPGEFRGRGPEMVLLEGRDYRVVSTQRTPSGGYLHLLPVETGAGATDR